MMGEHYVSYQWGLFIFDLHQKAFLTQQEIDDLPVDPAVTAYIQQLHDYLKPTTATLTPDLANPKSTPAYP